MAESPQVLSVQSSLGNDANWSDFDEPAQATNRWAEWHSRRKQFAAKGPGSTGWWV